ncbi:MAG: ABC-2 transporter permease [Bacilli bacterium]
MGKLFYKELKLVISPATYFFVLCSGLLLIPQYPYVIGVSYCLFGILITFGVARANNDHEFTAMLPVSRAQVVESRILSVVYTQLLQLLLAVPFALISSLVINTNGNPVGMDANFAFFGFVLIGYSVFNIIFLPWYFKSGYKTGFPMAFGITGYILTMLVFEIVVALVPFLRNNIDGVNPSNAIYQIIVLVAGILIYCITLLIAQKRSVKNFEKVSL